MPSIRNSAARCIRLLSLLPLTLMAAGAVAQNDTACPDSKGSTFQTFFLSHAGDQNQFSEILTVLRNDLQGAKINSIPAQSALAICGSPAELQLAQKVLADLDRPRKTWRVTYTFFQTDNGQRAATHHVFLIVASGESSEIKQGSRIPVVTGATRSDTPSNQVQYLDLGLSITTRLGGSADDPELRTKIEQSSLSEEKSGIGAQDPVVRQAVLEVNSNPVLGKPLVLGSLEMPGSTRHEEVEVTLEPLS
jgi:type II secretory pathway component GspD/PulD (secretin)